jgi:hypothetical protein
VQVVGWLASNLKPHFQTPASFRAGIYRFHEQALAILLDFELALDRAVRLLPPMPREISRRLRTSARRKTER